MKYTTGKIDIHNRPQYEQQNGDISTINSMSFNEDGTEVLIPTVDYDENGFFRQLTPDEAIKRYRETGRYLGRFPDVDTADLYAERLHNQQQNEILMGLAMDNARRMR